MPKLQNNNPVPTRGQEAIRNRNGYAVPKSNSYVEETKVIGDRRYPSESTIIRNGVFSMVDTALSTITQVSMASQQMEAENKFNDYEQEYSNITKRYKEEFQKNPNDEELTKNYNKEVNDLQNHYEKQIPEFHKTEFLERVNTMTKANNLDYFRETAKLNYQNEKFISGTNDYMQNVRNLAYTNNDTELGNQLMLLPMKKQQFLRIYGEINGTEQYKKFAKGVLNNIIDGKLSGSGFAEVKDVMELIKRSPEFADLLTLEEIKEKESLAKKKMVQVEKTKDLRNSIETLIGSSDLLTAIDNGKIQSYDQLKKEVEARKLDQETAEMLFYYAGYDELPSSLRKTLRKGGGKTVDKTEADRPKSDEEKEAIKHDLFQKMNSFYQGEVVEDKEFTRTSTKETVTKQVKDVQNSLVFALTNGYISRTEYDNYMLELKPTIYKLLKATTKSNFDDKGTWWKGQWDIGYEDLETEIAFVLQANGLPTAHHELEGADAKIKNKFYYISNRMRETYIKVMDEIFKEEKEKTENKDKYAKVDNFMDFMQLIPRDERKRIYAKALNYTLKNYGKNELGIDLLQHQNKNGEISTELLKSLITDKENENSIRRLDQFVWSDFNESGIYAGKTLMTPKPKKNQNFTPIPVGKKK